MGFRTATIVTTTCFLLGVLLMGLARADWPILYSADATHEDVLRAERYYLTLFGAPGAVPALLHAMVGICLISLCSKFARWEETNLFFDGSSIALMVVAIALYSSVTIPNLRILGRMPVLEQQATLGGRLRKWLARPMANPAEEILNPLSDADKQETVSLLCASNNLIIAALVGVLLFQGAQAYAHAQYEKELNKIRKAEKAQKAQ